jgi:hypothetical protein
MLKGTVPLNEGDEGTYATLRARQTIDSSIRPVFVPSLAAILFKAESEKGAPLTETEVLAIRDYSECIAMMPEREASVRAARGYDDITAETAWADWLILRETF